MTWFSQIEHSTLPLDDRSLVIALSNLLSRYDYNLPPSVVRNLLTESDAVIDDWSLPRAFKGFEVHEMSDSGNWPTTNLAIVKQRRIDNEAAGVIDHYSLVADQRAQSIIDSLDGKIKNANEYGPVLSWVSYTYTPEEPAESEDEPLQQDESIHVMEEGENIWDVGRRYHIPVDALIAENDIVDPRYIKPGTEIYLPVRLLGKKEEGEIHYEVLSPAREMHVSRVGGAKKWAFGGVKKWEDLYSVGRLYPDGKNILIVAVAHVPIGEDTAAYYMDAVSFGDYETTGLVRYTNGFNWQHLAEGYHKEGEPLMSEEEVEKVVADAMKEDDRPEVAEAVEEVKELPIIPAEPPVAPITYKSSFKFLNEDKRPVVYLFDEPLTIIEMDGKLPAKRVGKDDGVRIIGTFEKDGETYGRAALVGYWYGVPMDKITPEDDVYNTSVDLPTRIAMHGTLSPSERRLVMMAKVVSRYTKITNIFTKH